MPVLPLVASAIRMPGLSAPDRSPSRIIHSAARSLTEPPGLYHSALAYTSTFGDRSSAMLRSRISGVLPTRSNSEAARPAAGFCCSLSDKLTIVLFSLLTKYKFYDQQCQEKLHAVLRKSFPADTIESSTDLRQ